jgi:hypothetical protein
MIKQTPLPMRNFLCSIVLLYSSWSLLPLSTAQAQIGATKEEVAARHIESDFSFAYTLSRDGHVDYEQWYCESYHSAKVVLDQIEPAYTWKREPGSNWNWLGTAPGKPTLHALYWHFHNPDLFSAYHCIIVALAGAPADLWDLVMLPSKEPPSPLYSSP